MPEPDMTPLFEASLEQVMTEMERRHDSFIFAWTSERDKDSVDHGGWRRGNCMACIGLCRRLEKQIHRRLDDPDDDRDGEGREEWEDWSQ
jgi:hypothetical protein